MSRGLVLVTAIVGLAALVVGIVWTELQVASMSGVYLAGIGALALLVAAAMVGVHEAAALVSRRRRY
jgi:hypothetical protein